MPSRRHPSHPLVAAARLDRRAFLQRAAARATLVAAGATLAGCRSDGGGTGAGVAAPTSPPTPVPVPTSAFDPAVPYWLQGNFAPVGEEVDATELAVEGALPPELTGLYVRNGSNPATGSSSHWFLGDGMLHGVRLERGRAVWYRNRYVQTPLLAARTGLLGGGVPGRANNQSNVSVFAHGGSLLTSGEIGWPYRIDPETLATLGPHDYGGRLATSMTAHPKVDPATGKLHFFGYGFVAPYLTYHVAAADGTLEHSEAIEVPGPTMMHDFAITDRDVVFWDLPVVFSLQEAMKAVQGGGQGAFPFRWDPTYGARVGVMPLGGPASAIRWVDIDPCYVFHGTNAHRDGDTVVVDVCRLPAAFSTNGDLERSETHRWRVDLSGPTPTFADESLGVGDMDLPGIDRRFAGRPYRHGWYATVGRDAAGQLEFQGITRLDHVSGEIDRWEPGTRHRAGEGVFVPAAPDAAEGEGWILTYAYDPGTGRSDVVVLDALSMANGPVATVHLPARVPYGFHGTWLPDPV